MSLILALDTSTRQAAMAVYDTVADRSWSARDTGTRNHGRELIPALERLLEESGHRVNDLDAIAVGVGPGSYTGLRVGIAVAKALAEVLGIPVYPIDSLLLPVIASPPEHSGPCVSIADAQRGAVAVSIYGPPANRLRSRTNGPEIMPWNDMKRTCESIDHALLTGPGLDLAARLGETGVAQSPAHLRYPTTDALIEWLKRYFGSTGPVDPDTLEPEYLRPSAAEEKRQATAGTGPAPANP